MKKLICMLASIVCSVVVLVACQGTEKEPVYLTPEITVDENYHAIATYPDGTTSDLGYVGVEKIVEVEPPMYTVRFYDNDGNLLSEQNLFRGRDAEAPEAPTIEGLIFSGWDHSVTNVQSDLEIKPIYKEPTKVTVTFVDDDGTVLKTEEVIEGQAAHAPTMGVKGDSIFSHWSQDISCITEPTKVKAIYRARNTYDVTFLDYSGVELGTVSVKEGDAATSPKTPTREGYTFTGWSGNVSYITGNTTVSANYKFNGGTNVIDITYKKSKNTLTAVVTIKGTVKFCGMEGNITVPAGLTFTSASDGDGTVSNYNNGKIYFMFSSSNGKNVTSETRITTLTFSMGADDDVQLVTQITDIYDQDYNAVSSSVIGQTLCP